MKIKTKMRILKTLPKHDIKSPNLLSLQAVIKLKAKENNKRRILAILATRYSK
jgi:hypothetical protein